MFAGGAALPERSEGLPAKKRKMNMKQRLGILMILFVLSCSPMAGQMIQADKHFGAEKALSNNFVTALALDDDGYVWVGTESGLNRIAGFTCTVFKKSTSQKQESGLRYNDKILSLFYDENSNQLLVGTEASLSVYDCARGIFVHQLIGDSLVVYGLADIASRQAGGMWLLFGNGRLQWLDSGQNRLTNVQLEKTVGSRCVLDDGQGHLYVGHSHDGMTLFSVSKTPATLQHPQGGGKERGDGTPTAKVMRSFVHVEGDETSLPGNNVRKIFRDSRGNIWVGTDHGLALYDPLRGTFSKVEHQGQDFDDNVFDIKEMPDESLWVAMDVGGICTLSLREVDHMLRQGRLHFGSEPRFVLSSNNTRSILRDNYGNIWIGCHSTGLDFIGSRKPFLHRLPYFDQFNRLKRTYAVGNDGAGRLWVGSEDELSLWSAGRLEGEWRINNMRNRLHSFPRCLMADSQGYVWLGMEDEGVVRFNVRTHTFEPIDIGHGAADTHSFFEDTDGRIWIGSEHGLCIYDHGRISTESQIDQLIRKAPVTSIIRLTDHQLFITTQGAGAVVLNQQTMTAKPLTMRNGLPSNNINQALRGRRGDIWLGTNEGLVHVPDVATLKNIEVFNAQQGLSDNHVRAIAQDKRGRIWASTYTGIACFDANGKRFYNYNMQGDIAIGGFVVGSVAQTGQGLIAFGSPGGVYLFNPDDTGHAPVNDGLQVKIARCELFTPTNEGYDPILVVPDAKGVIRTNYQHNTLRFSFAVSDHALMNDVEFSYRMLGLSDVWFPVGEDAEVVFRSLPPGHYTFEVRAKLKIQDWQQASITRQQLYIAPPFWLSWWAYTLYALLAAAVVWYLFRLYKRKLVLQNSLELEKQENMQRQELNEERLRFFTNVAHELRTPLTLILGPLEDLKDDSRLSQHYRRRVGSIFTNAERLRNLINGILEFRKTETQNRRLTVARGNVGDFVREIGLNFQELNRNPSVETVLNVDDHLPPVFFDSEVITTIMNNLLSNAVKYTEQGTITIDVKSPDNGQHIAISVTDTGYGIAPEALPHGFERYYQAAGKHQASGTGIGLALVKSLAVLHEAQLHVDSTLGKGSRFTLLLDTVNTYPNALHKEDSVEPTRNESGEEPTEQPPQLPVLLVVEDNADIRQYIADSFCEDFRICQAANGQEGLEVARREMPDIIVCDIMMPRMNGIELTRTLKDDIRTSHIPIILLTAKDSVEDKEEGYDSGADSYLTKPFSAKLLGSRIQNLLANRRRLAEIIASRQLPMDVRTPADGHRQATAIADSSAAPADSGTSEPQMNRLDREFIDRLNRVIEENITLEDLDMTFMTDKMNMSHSTFYRKVKALTGMTAKEYIRKKRLQHCYRLLESSDYNVSEAALMTGFNQMAHFRELFKREFGILPSEVKDHQKG